MNTTTDAQGSSRDRQNVTVSNLRQRPAVSGATQQHTIIKRVLFRDMVHENRSHGRETPLFSVTGMEPPEE